MENRKTAFTEEERSRLINVIKNNLERMASGQQSRFRNQTDVNEEGVGPKLRQRVDRLRQIQSRHDELEAKYKAERAVLEAKYQYLYRPLYAERFAIVNGIVEVGEASKKLPPIAEEEEQDIEEEADVKGVPDFWLLALKHNDVVCEEITEMDEGALKYLKEIRWCQMKESKGFKLGFFFAQNPYFKNPILTKTYHMSDKDEPIFAKVIGSEIEWYPGKCLTQKKNGAETKDMILEGSKSSSESESFFHFFNPPQLHKALAVAVAVLDKDIAKEHEELLEQDYEIAIAIKEKIIPKAVLWYTGEAVDGCGWFDSDSDDDDNDDQLYVEDDDDDDDDDDETETKTESTQRKSGSKVEEGHVDGKQKQKLEQY